MRTGSAYRIHARGSVNYGVTEELKIAGELFSMSNTKFVPGRQERQECPILSHPTRARGSVGVHYYFYLRDEELGALAVCVASFLPFHTTY